MEDFDNYHTAYNGIKRGYIDQEGHIVIDSRNDEVYPMTPYGTIVKKDGLTAFLSPEGRTLIPPSRYTVGSIDIEDACLVLKSGYSGKCGLFDLSDGKQVIDFRYDDITLLGFNRALGKDGSRRYLLDTSTGDVIASLPPNIGAAHFNETPVTWIFRAKSYYGIIDEEGNIPVSYTHLIKTVKHGDEEKQPKYHMIDMPQFFFCEPMHAAYKNTYHNKRKKRDDCP